jgi:hypothetical protein
LKADAYDVIRVIRTNGNIAVEPDPRRKFSLFTPRLAIHTETVVSGKE